MENKWDADEAEDERAGLKLEESEDVKLEPKQEGEDKDASGGQKADLSHANSLDPEDDLQDRKEG